MEIAVCVKRVPMVGGRIVVTPDGQDVDTRMSGFAISPHEECAVEEAVQITERLGGAVSVLTLGPPEAADQLRDVLAHGAHRAVLLETDGREWGPMGTAAAIVAEVLRRAGDGVRARREYQGSEETFAFGLPAVVSVKEGINLPRYPSLPGRLRAKRAVIEQYQPQWEPEGLRKQALRVPESTHQQAAMLGTGADAVPALVRLLEELGLLK